MGNFTKLTSYSDACGCSTKLDSGALNEILSKIKSSVFDERLLSGFSTSDDASVYKVSDDLALIQTIDFFTPIVDDPYIFGQIAATNALSDIFAMGGDPKLALNILCIPNDMPNDVTFEILAGGNDKAGEAGAIIAGGHTITDEIPKYGLSVTGFAHPEKIYYNNTAKEGDLLILTKPLGVGVMNTAFKMDLIDDKEFAPIIESMCTLNKGAKDVMVKFDVHSVTDITGFGLLGHLYEMVKGSNVSAQITSDTIPIFTKVLTLAKDGIFPAAMYKNKVNFKEKTQIKNNVYENLIDVMYDPQTSGGLLIAVSEKDGLKLLRELRNRIKDVAIIGHVTKKEDKGIVIL